VSPPGSGVPVPARSGVDDVDVDRQETASQSVIANVDRLVEHHVHPSRHDLAHLEGTHALLGHPVQVAGSASNREVQSGGIGHRDRRRTR